MDNISGVRTIKVLHQSQVESLAIVSDGVAIETNSAIVDVPFTYGSAKVQSTPSSETGLSVFNNEIEFQLPSFAECGNFNGQNYILLITTTMGYTYVFGSLDYPMMANEEPLIPGSVSGYSGRKVKFTGISFNENPLLKILMGASKI